MKHLLCTTQSDTHYTQLQRSVQSGGAPAPGAPLLPTPLGISTGIRLNNVSKQVKGGLGRMPSRLDSNRMTIFNGAIKILYERSQRKRFASSTQLNKVCQLNKVHQLNMVHQLNTSCQHISYFTSWQSKFKTTGVIIIMFIFKCS